MQKLEGIPKSFGPIVSSDIQTEPSSIKLTYQSLRHALYTLITGLAGLALVRVKLLNPACHFFGIPPRSSTLLN